jgi:hypothetical protein
MIVPQREKIKDEKSKKEKEKRKKKNEKKQLFQNLELLEEKDEDINAFSQLEKENNTKAKPLLEEEGTEARFAADDFFDLELKGEDTGLKGEKMKNGNDEEEGFSKGEELKGKNQSEKKTNEMQERTPVLEENVNPVVNDTEKMNEENILLFVNDLNEGKILDISVGNVTVEEKMNEMEVQSEILFEPIERKVSVAARDVSSRMDDVLKILERRLVEKRRNVDSLENIRKKDPSKTLNELQGIKLEEKKREKKLQDDYNELVGKFECMGINLNGSKDVENDYPQCVERFQILSNSVIKLEILEWVMNECESLKGKIDKIQLEGDEGDRDDELVKLSLKERVETLEKELSDQRGEYERLLGELKKANQDVEDLRRQKDAIIEEKEKVEEQIRIYSGSSHENLVELESNDLSVGGFMDDSLNDCNKILKNLLAHLVVLIRKMFQDLELEATLEGKFEKTIKEVESLREGTEVSSEDAVSLTASIKEHLLLPELLEGISLDLSQSKPAIVNCLSHLVGLFWLGIMVCTYASELDQELNISNERAEEAEVKLCNRLQEAQKRLEEEEKTKEYYDKRMQRGGGGREKVLPLLKEEGEVCREAVQRALEEQKELERKQETLSDKINSIKSVNLGEEKMSLEMQVSSLNKKISLKQSNILETKEMHKFELENLEKEAENFHMSPDIAREIEDIKTDFDEQVRILNLTNESRLQRIEFEVDRKWKRRKFELQEMIRNEKDLE